MRGVVEGRRVVIRLAVEVDDMDGFLSDPVHRARIGGTVHIEGLTRGPAPVREGTLHLLATAEGGPRRTMDYALPFTAGDGTQWWLQGSKQVVRRGLRGPWRATTELDLSLTRPEERYDALGPTGRATISFPDALRLVTTIRPTGTRNPMTVARFGAFFTTEVARAFLGRTPTPGEAPRQT